MERDLDLSAWGLCPHTVGDAGYQGSVDEALAAISQERGQEPLEPPVQAYVGDDLVYLADEYIGSLGVLYVPSTATLVRLGSYASLDDFLWAFHRGLDIAGRTTLERETTLTITTVRDPMGAITCLESILRRQVLADEIATVPARFEALDLYFDIRALRQMEDAGVCDFRLTAAVPASSPKRPA